MSEILPGIHLVDGVNPSPQFSTNMLLLKDAKGPTWTLVDTGLPPSAGSGGQPGYPGALPFLEKYCASRNISLRSIRSILITHLHRDHTGNLKAVAQKTGAKIYAHWIEAAYIANDPPYKGKGMPPLDPVEVHEKLKDGYVLGDLFDGLVAVYAPGHTPGHTAYYCPSRKLLFPGDAVFGGEHGLHLTPPEYTFSQSMALISARRLAELDVEGVVEYHGNPVLKDARAALREAARNAHPGDDSAQP